MVIDWRIQTDPGHCNIIYNMHTEHTRYHLQGQAAMVNNDIYKLDSKFLPITHTIAVQTLGARNKSKLLLSHEACNECALRG